jgi:hypothetical protein
MAHPFSTRLRRLITRGLYHTWEISKQPAIAYRKRAWNVIAVLLKERPA